MGKKDIVIVGSGGLAREVRWLLEECNKYQERWNILGWVSNENAGTIISGLPVLGSDDWLLHYDKPVDVAISVGSGSLRKQIVDRCRKNPNVNFPNLIAPNVSLSDSVELGIGCIITAQSILTVDIKIGDFFVCSVACTVAHDCKFGDFVTLLPGAHISGNVTLGDGVSIGTGATIIQGISVGEEAFIGAGAAVVKNIPQRCVAVGVPAKPLER